MSHGWFMMIMMMLNAVRTSAARGEHCRAVAAAAQHEEYQYHRVPQVKGGMLSYLRGFVIIPCCAGCVCLLGVRVSPCRVSVSVLYVPSRHVYHGCTNGPSITCSSLVDSS